MHGKHNSSVIIDPVYACSHYDITAKQINISERL